MASVAADLQRGRAVLCRLEQEIAKLAPHPGGWLCGRWLALVGASECCGAPQHTSQTPRTHLRIHPPRPPNPLPSFSDNGLTRPGAFLFELLGGCGISPATWQVRDAAGCLPRVLCVASYIRAAEMDWQRKP